MKKIKPFQPSVELNYENGKQRTRKTKKIHLDMKIILKISIWDQYLAFIATELLFFEHIQKNWVNGKEKSHNKVLWSDFKW